jgi:hypothetical protein
MKRFVNPGMDDVSVLLIIGSSYPSKHGLRNIFISVFGLGEVIIDEKSALLMFRPSMA